MNTEWNDQAGHEPVDHEALATTPAVPTSPAVKKGSKRVAAIAGSLLVGGGAIVALLGPLSASAASPSPDPSAAAASAPADPAAGGAAAPAATAPATNQAPTASSGTDEASEPAGDTDGKGGHVEAATDTSVAAKAIGITEADLVAQLQAGKTMAAVATANKVDPQKVIDALTQDGLDELAAEVTAGTLTQAQADAEKANVATRAAGQVNGTFQGGGPGGHGGHDGAGGHVEAATDTSVAAKAIGITEADLVAQLQAGKTMAAVATANKVDPQKVIDALTQDGLDELAAEVTAGTLTQAQADAEKANVATRAAGQVNGTFQGGGPGGHGGHDGAGEPANPGSSAAPTTSGG